MRGVLLATLATALLGISGCGSKHSAQKEDANSGKLKIVGTVGMIADVAARIAGDHASVSALMGPGIDPHLYLPSQNDITLLRGADVVFYNGLNLEGKMGDMLEKEGALKKDKYKSDRVFAVARAIDVAQLRKPPEFEGHFDPHIWFDVSLWTRAAETIRDALVAVDPAHAADYKKNAEALLKEMKELHEWCKTEIAKIPQESRILITAHDAFGYFGRAYGLEVRGILGISTDSQSGLVENQQLIELIVKRKVKAVFVESSVDPKRMQQLIEGCKARGHDVKNGGELFSDAMGESGKEGDTYIGMVQHNVKTIVEALK
jgi:manganese/zinc/iron transport system substrate-binding protein